MTNTDIPPSQASTTSASSSATPGSRRTSTATPSASTSSPTPAWRPSVKHEAGYVLRQGDITFVLTSPLRHEHPDSQRLDARTATASWTSPSKWTTSRAAYRRRRRPRRRRRHAADAARGRDGVYEYATIRAYGDTTHTLRQPRPLPGRLRPGLQAASTRTATARARSTRSASRRSTTSSATSKKAR